jgi:hypothetical protein
MATGKFLQKSAFTPEDIEKLTEVFESALHQLNLKNRESTEAEEVARRIMVLAEDLALDTRELAWRAVQSIRGA